MINLINKFQKVKPKKLKILEVNDIDLPGRRFNGYDLQQFINKETVHGAKQIVTYKLSDDKNVEEFYINKNGLEIEQKLIENESEILSVHSQLSLTSNILKNHKDFNNADVVHYHLIHNTRLNLNQMIELCNKKPSILSIHDPWNFTGRCVHPEDCNKWKTGCKKCEKLDNLFPFNEDNCHSLWKLKKKIYNKLDVDIVVSTPFMLEFVKQSPLTKHFKNVHLIPFGIDLNKFNNNISQKEAREKLGINKNDIVLFFRAQKEFKGTNYIIEAMKKLETDENITLLTCSEVGLLDELKYKYNVIDLGYIETDKIIMAYNACDIFLMPSRGESFGLMAVEAMACSRPVIIFDNSALPSVTFAPDCGFLVENRNAHKLMEAIKYLIKNKKERIRRGKLGRKLAEENYDINIYNKKMLQFYESVYKRHKNNKKKSIEITTIDYSLVDVQNLIQKLKKICYNIFNTDDLPIEFLKHEQKNYNSNLKIDYSLDSIQEVINQFNDFIYNIFKKNNKKLSIFKKIIFLWKNDRQKLKDIIKARLKNCPKILKLLKFIYSILRKLKHFLKLKKINKIQNKKENINLKDFCTQKNIFYYHGGSGNHGCEALVRTLVDINNFKYSESCLYSYVPQEDLKFGINKIIKYIYLSNLDAEEINNNKLSKNAIALSIGGDNYCGYDYGTKRLAKYNRKFNEMGIKTALIGCSIEPDVLEHQEVLDDLNRFSLITARESITYEALIKKGIKRNTHLIPDSAFTLEKKELPLPKGFKINNIIGLNLSDLVQTYDKKKDFTLRNYRKLIEYIINNTKYQIALIPHVVQSFNDDLQILTKLYDEYSKTGRVILIKECNCNEIKGYISRCKIFIGSRTHATIAAYSSMVPTLVLGYSVKSRGIAKDIFETEKNYVLPVQSLKKDDDLTKAFIWIDNNYNKIKRHLKKIMPNYIKQCYKLKPLIDNLKEKGVPREALAELSLCNGCGVCASICPIKCITMEPNKEGFLYPKIDYTKCIDCGLCRKRCPINQNIKRNIIKKAYAAINKDEPTRLKSSSGGIFSLIASKVIEGNGIVYGAALNENNDVYHVAITSKKDLEKLYGSKYVQSDLKNTYFEIKKYLNKGKKVLFSGTPCQVLGLKLYLNKNYDNLFIIDFICHGVPSPKVFKKYKEFLEKKYNSKLTKISFRNKSKGWKLFGIKCSFSNSKNMIEDSNENIYMKAFLKNLTLRESCFNCKAKGLKSGSDITLADFWGIEKIHKKFNDNKGTSLVIINSIKGKKIFKNIKNNIYFKKTNLYKASSYNICMTKSVAAHPNRKEFFDKIDEENIIDLMKKNLD